MAGFNTAITGLKAATTDLDVTGNNIANSSTVGFKASRTEFGDIYTSAVVGAGSSNVPGSGVTVTDIAQDFAAGTTEFTNSNLDLAIDGAGFFQLSDEQGGLTYTRAGSFELDKDGFIVNKTGQFLRGYPVVNDIELPLGNLSVSEKESAPQATSTMDLSVNIDSRKDANELQALYDKDVPGSYTYSTTMERVDALGDSSAIKYNFVEQRPVKETHTYDYSGGAGDTFFISDAAITLTLSTVGTADGSFEADGTLKDNILAQLQDDNVDKRIFDVVQDQPSVGKIQVIFKSDSTQYGDLVVGGAAGLINEDIGEVTAGEQHYFSFGDPATTTSTTRFGAGNTGIELSVSGINISIETGASGVTAQEIVNEINAQRTSISGTNSNIESFSLEFDDSGAPQLLVNYRPEGGDVDANSLDLQVLSGVNPFDPALGVGASGVIAPDLEINGDPSYQGTYRLYAYLLNPDDSEKDQLLVIGKGADPGEGGSELEKGPILLKFDDLDGNISEINGQTVTSTLAIPQLTVQGFTDNDQILANDTDSQSVIKLDLTNTTQFASDSIKKSSAQNGYPKGDLIGVSFGLNGEMVASFSNGQNQTLGVVAVATFENQAGLQPVGDTQWAASLSSGNAIPNPPGSGLNGTLRSGALEQSNVDLSEQLVKLIVAQRNFQANSKTLETLNTVTQAILQI